MNARDREDLREGMVRLRKRRQKAELIKGIGQPELPCDKCGILLKNHFFVQDWEIKTFQEQGFAVNICNSAGLYNVEDFEGLVLASLTKNPCDTEFMKEISS